MDPDVTRRTPGRVMIAMPDFTADAVAHVLRDLGELADRIHLERDWTGERELAAALQEAARAAGYRCPTRLDPDMSPIKPSDPLTARPITGDQTDPLRRI